MQAEIDPPFGTYALPPAKEAMREKAGGYAATRWGRAMISRYRKKAMSGLSEPYDVEIAPDVKARLYPSGNRCEKRAFAGVQIWDAPERAALQSAVQAAGAAAEDVPFVFLDVGANVGLYSVFVNAYAANAGTPCRIIAIEPGLETCRRLETNIAANQADIQIIRAAISDAPGSGFLTTDDENRGEAKLVSGGHDNEPVVIDTLARICRAHNVPHISAMKLDIEGYDLKALSGFFEDAPERLYPSLLILETGRDAASPLIELCAAQGYVVKERAGLNSILVKNTDVKT